MVHALGTIPAPRAEIIAETKHQSNIRDGTDDQEDLDNPAVLVDEDYDGYSLIGQSAYHGGSTGASGRKEETEKWEVERMAELVQPICEPSLLERTDEATQYDCEIQRVRDEFEELWVAVLDDRYYVYRVTYCDSVAEIETPYERDEAFEEIRVCRETSVVESHLDGDRAKKTDSKKNAYLKDTDCW